MIVWNVAKTQWLRLYRNKLSRSAIIALSFIPLLYCGLYLYAFWNPYGSLNKLPVALVVEDQGGIYHGKPVNYGKDLAKQIKEKIDLKWEQVSAKTAQTGIVGNRYYLVVTVPKDFTKQSLSITTSKPAKSQLVFTRNEGKNYIAGQIANRVETQIAEEVSNQFTKQYVQNLLELMLQAKSGLSKATSGAQKLAAGANQLFIALNQLSLGIQKASFGATKVDQGTGKLVTGSAHLASGASQVAGGTRQIANEANKIGDMINNLQSGQTDQLQKLQTELTRAKGLLDQLDTNLNQAAVTNSNLSSLVNQVADIRTRLNTLTNLGGQLTNILSNIGTVQAKLAQVQKLANGADQVAAGAKQLSQGVNQVKNGTSQLSAGIHTIQFKLPLLVNGAKALQNGNQELAIKLAQATREQQADPAILANIISNPLQISDQSIYKVSLYGVGLAPYFLPLSLWIGGLMLYFGVPVSEKRWRLFPSHPWFVQVGKLLTFVPFGFVQSMLTGLVIQYILGLPIEQPLYYYLFLFCLSLMSIAIIGALINVLGSGPGRLISVVLLVLQLVSSGGTFPIDLIPYIFQVIHPYLPMTYGVEGLRHIIVYHQSSQLATPFLMVFIYLASAVALTFLRQQRKFRLSELQERDQLEVS